MSIHDEMPIDLFDYSDLDKSYKSLVKKYHPDHGGSEDDFVYLKSCYEKAKFEIETGQAIGKDAIYILTSDKKREIKYSSSVEFSYGKVYVGEKYLIYEFTPNNVLVKDNGDIFPPLQLADDGIREAFISKVPSVGIEIISIEAKGILVKQFIVIGKSLKTILLCDVMKHKIPLATSVWMFNRLYAMGCFMSAIGVYNLDISPYNILVDLEDHSIQLLGGWWYSYSPGDKLKRMPMSTYNLLTNKMKETKTASIEIVTEQIKNVMQKILEGRNIPKVYANWLSLPAQKNIINEYSQWENEVMPKIFPVRKFYRWTI
jgi:hypothetical protein